jgi:hypothetical protein
MRRLAVASAGVGLAAAVLVASALGGPFFTSSTPRVVHPGETVTLRAIRYQVPAGLAPGRYAYVLWCRWCGGSLIAWPTRLAHPGGTAIRAGTAVVVR